MTTTREAIVAFLDEKAAVGYDVEMLARCAASRGIEWRGRAPHEVVLRGEEFRKGPVALSRATTTAHPRRTETSGAAVDQLGRGLQAELASAMLTNGIIRVLPGYRVAVHEAGHVVVGRHLASMDPAFAPQSVEMSYAPPAYFRGVAGGTPFGETTYRGSATGEFPAAENIRSYLAGKVAETLVFGGIEDAATSDIDRAMGEAERLGDDADLVCGEAWREARRILIQQCDQVEIVARALYRHLHLSGADIDRLLLDAA